MIDFSNFPVLNLGDLVEFITKKKEYGFNTLTIKKDNKTTIFKSGNTKMIAPTMVVIEVVAENRSRTKNSPGYPIKVRCQWFSQQTNSFLDRWFNIEVLNKLKSAKLKPTNFELNQIVALSTLLISNVQQEQITKYTLKEEIGKTEYKISKNTNSLSFTPPKLTITSIKDKDRKSKADPNKRKDSLLTVKCMWYDHTKGKFSEHEFIPEALVLFEKVKINFLLPSEEMLT